MDSPLTGKPHPLVYEINARVLVRTTAELLGRPATLADVPESLIAEWQALGFDAIWVMGVWTTGAIGKKLSAEEPAFNQHHAAVLPDWTPDDVTGSPYAVAAYEPSPDFGGIEALRALRKRLVAAGLGLILDFVPNHTARDHRWVAEHPEYYVGGGPNAADEQPQFYVRQGDHIFAYGRDPYFPGWVDTFQLDYRKAATRSAMLFTLLDVAEECDGVRCDMAMLVLQDIFRRTWGDGPNPAEAKVEFWSAAIDAVRARHPDFRFIAEAYWGLEERLQLLGFDHTYNKSLYDMVVHQNMGGLRDRLYNPEYLYRSVHFLENHDEPRAAASLPDDGYRRAATLMTMTLPGMRLIHDGEIEARRVHHSVHLGRRRVEEPNKDEIDFFQRILTALAQSTVGRGGWHVVESRPTWQGDHTHRDIFAFLWGDGEARDLAVVNLSPASSEAFLAIKFPLVAGRTWRLADRLSNEVYDRDGDEMSGGGLFVRLHPHQVQLFALSRA